jgi:hypothetical protein
MIAVQPHLNATKRSIGFSSQDPPDFGQLVEQVTIHHGHCASETKAKATQIRITTSGDDQIADSPSSIINTCVLVHRLRAFLFLRMFWQSFSGVSAPSPIPTRIYPKSDLCSASVVLTNPSAGRPDPPPKLCIVIPPILQAAIPVLAVTATASPFPAHFFFNALMISLKRTDFPVPADPVKKTDRPWSTTMLSTLRCSEERMTFCRMLRVASVLAPRAVVRGGREILEAVLDISKDVESASRSRQDKMHHVKLTSSYSAPKASTLTPMQIRQSKASHPSPNPSSLQPHSYSCWCSQSH